MENILKIYNT